MNLNEVFYYTFVSVLNTTYVVMLCCREYRYIEDENRRDGVVVERTLRVREIGVRSPVATDTSRKHR